MSGYSSPAVLPEVHSLPQIEIQRRLCVGRRCRVKANYHPQSGVIVDESLDFQGDPVDSSLLLHELVHHLQRITGKFEVVTSFCSRRISEELEAYEIQNRYLSGIHASRRAFVMGWNGKCADNDEALRPEATVRRWGERRLRDAAIGGLAICWLPLRNRRAIPK